MPETAKCGEFVTPPDDELAALGVDVEIARIATAQHGIITSRQLTDSGLSRNGIHRRARTGRLHRMHRGVYAVGHASLSKHARIMAAVLACGDGAVASGTCAAELWGISRRRSRTLDVLVPRRHNALAGVIVHSTRSLPSADVTTRYGIPVTTVARTLVDLASELTPHQIARLMHEAEYLELLDVVDVEQVMHRRRNGRGLAVMTAALDIHRSGSVGTRSRLEDRLLAIIADAGLSAPRVNTCVRVPGGSLEADFHWPTHRLCVEVDGVGHRRASTRRVDAVRDARLVDAGQTVIRLNAHDLGRRHAATMRRLAEHLNRRPGR